MGEKAELEEMLRSTSSRVMSARAAMTPLYRSAGMSTAGKKLNLQKNPLSMHSLNKYSSVALVGLIPAALLLEPSALVYPLDLALGLVLPLHMQLGMQEVIRDYAPKSQKRMLQYILMGVSVATALGLTKLNFNGEGVAAGAKRLWKKTKKD